MKLNFTYNLEKDIANFLIASKSLGHNGKPSKVQQLYMDKYGQELDEDKLNNFIREYSEKYKINFLNQAEKFQNSWNLINEEIFKRMENIFKVKLPTNNIMAYLTINDRCSYNPGINEQWYFFVNANIKFPEITCLHEIFHFYTHLSFGNYLKNKGLNQQKFFDIKEALTVILNHEFIDLMGNKDMGYIEHKELRDKISDLWQQTRNIKNIVDSLI